MRVSKLFFILFLSTSAVSVKALDCWAMGDGDESDVVLEDLMELGEVFQTSTCFFWYCVREKTSSRINQSSG